MAYNQCEVLRLELTLRRIAMISIAQSLWKSADITKQLEILVKEGIGYYNSFYNIEYPDSIENWEQILDMLLNKVNILPLPEKIRNDLQEVVILMAEEITNYYHTVSKKRIHCEYCESSAGPSAIHSYYFTSCGFLKRPCTILHLKYVPKEGKTLHFFHDACKFAREDLVRKYQNEIMAHLESVKPGLNLKDKEDKAFNIICVWNYVYLRGIGGKPNRLPKQYLKNKDYIIPLKVVYEMIVKDQMEDRVFEIRAEIFFNSLPELEFYKSPVLDFRRKFAPDDDSLYHAFQFIPEDRLPFFFLENAPIVIHLFLLKWSYLELIPQILDLFLKNNSKSQKTHAIFECMVMGIALENRLKHSAKKAFYFKLLNKIWQMVPNSERSTLLADVIFHGSHSFWLNFPIINLTERDFRYYDDIDKKCKMFLKVEKCNEVLMEFLNGVVISIKDIEKFDSYIGSFYSADYNHPKHDGYSSDENDGVWIPMETWAKVLKCNKI